MLDPAAGERVRVCLGDDVSVVVFNEQDIRVLGEQVGQLLAANRGERSAGSDSARAV